MNRKSRCCSHRKPVDCPSGAADHGDVDRLGSRRVRENSQRRNLCFRFLKSYLPTHGVCHKTVCRSLLTFADAPRAGSAEAKHYSDALTTKILSMHPVQAAPRQSDPRTCSRRAARDAPRAGSAVLRRCSRTTRRIFAVSRAGK